VRHATIAFLVVSLVLAGCGGSSGESDGESFESVFAAVDGLRGPARERKLLGLVEAEGGNLSFYTSMSSDVEEQVVEAFEDAYDLDVAVYRASSETVLQRLLEEAKAGFRGADIVESSGLEMFNLNREELLVPYDSPAAAELVPGTRYDGWLADRFNTFVVSWNTDLVEPGEQPRSWEDLADSKWHGRIGLEAGDVDWYKTLWEYWVEEGGKSRAEADRLFEAIARNSLVIKGHTVMGQLLAAGEFAVAPNYLHTTLNLMADGAPLAWEPAVEPIIPRPNGIGLIRDAKHPAAAVLFTDWLLGKGQEVLDEMNVDPAARAYATGSNLRETNVDLATLAAEQERWTERFDRLASLGKEVPDG
jgi:iron(III) transport system substrate-binding protein